MSLPSPDIDAVTRLIQQVAREVVVPRFRTLADDEILHKETAGYAEDVVTVVDREAEDRLTSGLLQLMPSAHVIGEEAAHQDPAILDGINSDGPVWIIDPLDGTHNFAAGHDGFGIMVGFAVGGRIRAGWVHMPVRDECFVAEAGSGTVLNGVPVRAETGDGSVALRGSLFTRFMPPDLRAVVLERTRQRFVDVRHAGAAAVEYTDVLRGRKDFVVYYRLLPWDHGAPALILTEAGGRVEHVDGSAYTVRSPNQLTIVARTAAIAQQARGWLAR